MTTKEINTPKQKELEAVVVSYAKSQSCLVKTKAKKEKQNMAIVVDEHGCNCGLITMDDILRSVFGRITENFDDAEGNPVNRIHVINASKFSVPGEIRLEDLNSVFPVNLDSEEFDTLGGWLLEQFGSLPSTGEALKRGNVIYLVEDQAQRRIKSVLMTFV